MWFTVLTLVVLMMPPENNTRLITARSLFQSVIDAESDFAGGYAGKSLPYLNLLGIAQYVIGDYDAALRGFERNLDGKGPTGPHMNVFMAATYAQLGREFQAEAILSKLLETNPDYPAEQWMARYIKSEDELQETLELLRSLGFSILR